MEVVQGKEAQTMATVEGKELDLYEMEIFQATISAG